MSGRRTTQESEGSPTLTRAGAGECIPQATQQWFLVVLNGESSERLAPPRNAKYSKHLQSTWTTVHWHNSQSKHQALSKGQPRSQDAQHQRAQRPCMPSAQLAPAIITHTQLGHHQILSANVARCEAEAG